MDFLFSKQLIAVIKRLKSLFFNLIALSFGVFVFVFFVRIEELFNMIVEFPDSLPALNDLKVTHTYSK